MFRHLIAISLALSLLCATGTAVAGDAAAGKAKAEKSCAECHEAGDWKGKSEAELQQKIGNVVAGKAKHPKKPELTAAEVSDIAAYWAAGKP